MVDERDDGRLLRIGLDGTATELVNQKGRWVEHLATHRVTGAVAASIGKSAFVVKDANGQALAYVYFEDEPGRRSAAKVLSKDARQSV